MSIASINASFSESRRTRSRQGSTASVASAASAASAASRGASVRSGGAASSAAGSEASRPRSMLRSTASAASATNAPPPGAHLTSELLRRASTASNASQRSLTALPGHHRRPSASVQSMSRASVHSDALRTAPHSAFPEPQPPVSTPEPDADSLQQHSRRDPPAVAPPASTSSSTATPAQHHSAAAAAQMRSHTTATAATTTAPPRASDHPSSSAAPLGTLQEPQQPSRERQPPPSHHQQQQQQQHQESHPRDSPAEVEGAVDTALRQPSSSSVVFPPPAGSDAGASRAAGSAQQPAAGGPPSLQSAGAPPARSAGGGVKSPPPPASRMPSDSTALESILRTAGASGLPQAAPDSAAPPAYSLRSFEGAPHPALARALRESQGQVEEEAVAAAVAASVGVSQEVSGVGAAPQSAAGQPSQAEQAGSGVGRSSVVQFSTHSSGVGGGGAPQGHLPSAAVAESLPQASAEAIREYLSGSAGPLASLVSLGLAAAVGEERQQPPSQGTLLMEASLGSTRFSEAGGAAGEDGKTVDLSASQIIEKHMSDYASAFRPASDEDAAGRCSGDNPFALPSSLPYARDSVNPYQMPDIPPGGSGVDGVHSVAPSGDDGEGAEGALADASAGGSQAAGGEGGEAVEEERQGAVVGAEAATQVYPQGIEAVVGRKVWEPRKREHLADFVGVFGAEKMEEYRRDPIKALEIASASMIQDITKDLVDELENLKGALFRMTSERDELVILVEELRRQLAERQKPPPSSPPPKFHMPEAPAPAHYDNKLILNWVLFQKQLREAQAEAVRMRTQLVAKDMLAARAEKAEEALVKAELALMDAQAAYDDLADCREADIDALTGMNNSLREMVNARVPRDDFATMQEKAARHQHETAEQRAAAQREQARLQGELASAQEVIRRIEEAAKQREAQLQELLVQSGEEQERLLRQLIASEQALLPELREKLIVQRETIAGLLKTVAGLERLVGTLRWDKEAAEILAETTENEREALERELEALRREHEQTKARLEQALKENGEIPKLRKLILDAQAQIKLLVERITVSEEYVLKHKDTITQLKAAHRADMQRLEERIREEMKGEAGELVGRHYASLTRGKSTVRSTTSYPGNSVKTRPPGPALPLHSSVGSASVRDYGSSLVSCSPLNAVHILHDRFAVFPSAASMRSFCQPRNVSPLRERL